MRAQALVREGLHMAPDRFHEPSLAIAALRVGAISADAPSHLGTMARSDREIRLSLG